MVRPKIAWPWIVRVQDSGPITTTASPRPERIFPLWGIVVACCSSAPTSSSRTLMRCAARKVVWGVSMEPPICVFYFIAILWFAEGSRRAGRFTLANSYA